MTDQELLQAIGQVVEAKLEYVRKDICELKDSVRKLETGMDQMEIRMDQLETRMSRIDTRMDRLEFNMDRLGSRIKQLELGMDQLGINSDDLANRINGIRIYMETDQQRTLNLLLEGQQSLWDRFVPREEFEPLEGRTKVLELAVKRHSQEIRELKRA